MLAWVFGLAVDFGRGPMGNSHEAADDHVEQLRFPSGIAAAETIAPLTPSARSGMRSPEPSGGAGLIAVEFKTSSGTEGPRRS